MLTVLQLSETLMTTLWGMLRVSGVVLVAPIFGAIFAPARLRILMTAVFAVAMLPVITTVPDYSPFSIEGFITVAQEMLVGLSIGFILKLAVEAAVFAGQVISMGMGLSFATVVDPQNGGIPLLGRLYIIVATLLLLAADAHLGLIALLAKSFEMLPVGAGGIGPTDARDIVEFASLLFIGAMQLALPTVVAILMVNVAFGVISRAAPTLNLFAVGLPISMLMGFIVMVLAIRGQGAVWDLQLTKALTAIGRLVAGG